VFEVRKYLKNASRKHLQKTSGCSSETRPKTQSSLDDSKQARLFCHFSTTLVYTKVSREEKPPSYTQEEAEKKITKNHADYAIVSVGACKLTLPFSFIRRKRRKKMPRNTQTTQLSVEARTLPLRKDNESRNRIHARHAVDQPDLLTTVAVNGCSTNDFVGFVRSHNH
jgi:hypothetical protein